MKSLIFALYIFVCSWSFSQLQKIETQFDDIKIVYHKKDDKKEGNYKVIYKNGKLKVKGNYTNNKRSGLWYFYNDEGQLLFIREYKDGEAFYQFKNEKDLKTENKDLFLLSSTILHQINPDSSLLNNVYWSERNIIQIDISKNKELEKSNLQHILLEIAYTHKFPVYSAANNTFTDTINGSHIIELLKNICAYKVKEDWFLSTKSNKLEKRIVGICPIAKINGKLEDICWFYYPNLEKELSQHQVIYEDSAMNIKNYFSKSNYVSEVIEFSNFKHKTVKELANSKQEKAQLLNRHNIYKYYLEEKHIIDMYQEEE